jgi:hypothetical protein
MIKKVKCKGQQGSWFAKVSKGLEQFGIEAGTELPCVHAHFFKVVNGKAMHDEPNYRKAYHAKFNPGRVDTYFDAVRNGNLVIVTQSESHPDDGDAWRRSAYVAVYRISNFRIEDDHIRWDYDKRLAECE